MSLKQDLINSLPPFRNEKKLIKQRQGTNDIIKSVLKIHGEYESDYDSIYPYFDRGNVYTTAQRIWEFLKYNLTYNAESGEDQSVKSPSAILHPGEKIDCKHYALFAGGILDAIKQNESEPWDWCFRFASDKSTDNVSHVFVVVFDQDQEYWIDPCLASFNQRKKYILIEDVKPMPLYKISGVGDVSAAPAPMIDVDKKTAFASFLTMVNMNAFGLKDLLKSNSNITNGPLRAYLTESGLDFNQVENFLKA